MLENISVLICVTFNRFHWLPLSTLWSPNLLWGTGLPSASSLIPGRVLDPLKLKNPITLQPGWPVQTLGDSPAASVPRFSAAWASQIVGQVMSEGEQNLLHSGARNAAWQLQPISCAHDRHTVGSAEGLVWSKQGSFTVHVRNSISVGCSLSPAFSLSLSFSFSLIFLHGIPNIKTESYWPV